MQFAQFWHGFANLAWHGGIDAVQMAGNGW